MITDDRKPIRELAVSRIIQAREQNTTERAFQLPKTLNFDAEDYSDMIDWEREIITQPPIIKGFSNAEIYNIANEPVKTIKFPCHSQGVERAVNIVTQPSLHRIGYENRHEYILNLLESRKHIPQFEWKGQWPLLLYITLYYTYIILLILNRYMFVIIYLVL